MWTHAAIHTLGEVESTHYMLYLSSAAFRKPRRPTVFSFRFDQTYVEDDPKPYTNSKPGLAVFVENDCSLSLTKMLPSDVSVLM